jgi:HTH-type transcriptional regulator / antitoxin HipB
MAEDRDLLLSQIGLRVLRRRQELGLTQTELADRLGIGRPNIYRIEHGKQNVTVDTLCKLAEALGITAVELFSGMVPGASPAGARRTRGDE